MRIYRDISGNIGDTFHISDDLPLSEDRRLILEFIRSKVVRGTLLLPTISHTSDIINTPEQLVDYFEVQPPEVNRNTGGSAFNPSEIRISGTRRFRSSVDVSSGGSIDIDNEFRNTFVNPEEVLKLKAEGKVRIGTKIYKLDSSSIAEDYFNPGNYVLKENSRNCFTNLDKNGKGLTESIVYYNTNDGHKFIVFILTPKRGDCEEQRFDANKLDILTENGYIEHLKDGKWYHNSWVSELKNSKEKGIYRKTKAFKSLKQYADKKSQFQFGLDSPTYLISEGKKYTFGIELETCKGYLPQWLDSKLNYICEYDGSLKDSDGNTYGGEYVTGVLKGDMGFKHLKLLCSELSRRCSINYKCGAHVHIGDVNFNQEFIVYFYKLCLMIEKEIFDTLPPSRRNNEYCKKLKKFNIDLKVLSNFESAVEYNTYIESVYNEILLWVSTKKEFDSTYMNKKHDHPRGAKCQYDHSSARYSWVNFVPALFNTRHNGSYTVEFRPAAGTTNYIKVRNWTLLCMAIVYVAENNKQLITSSKTITIEDVLKCAYPKKYQELVKYFDGRKVKFNAEEGKGNEELEYRDEIEVDNNLSFGKL